MKNNYLLILVIILSNSLIFGNSKTCHYSCSNCTAEAYTNCFQCSDPSDELIILQDKNFIPAKYIHSVYPSGACTASVPNGANQLGILLLLFSIIGLLITQSFQAFFIISTLQSIALFGLLQIAWKAPTSYILQSFQYYMPINLIISSAKLRDFQLFVYGFYRLDRYMINSQDTGLIAVFIIQTLLFIAVIILYIIIYKRKINQDLDNNNNENNNQFINAQNGSQLVPQFSTKSDKQIQKFGQGINYSNQKDILPQQTQNKGISSGKQMPKTSFKQQCLQKLRQCCIIRKIMRLLMYLFFLLIQQTVLSIMVGAVFQISGFDIAVWIVYFIEVITIMIIGYFQYQKQNNPKEINKQQLGLSLFVSKQSMLLIIIKKAILPLGIVLPLQKQYIYFIIYIVFYVLQGSIDSQSSRIPCLSRITIYKILQIIMTSIILSYFFIQKRGNTKQTATFLSVFFSVIAIIFTITLIIQFIFSFIGIFFGSNKVNNQEIIDEKLQEKHQYLNNTEQTLNQINCEQNNNVFESIKMNRQNKQQIQIIDYQQSQNDNTVNNKYGTHQNALVIQKNNKIQNNTDKTNQSSGKKLNNNNKQSQSQQKQIKLKKKQKKRILDPQLRKRYGM